VTSFYIFSALWLIACLSIKVYFLKRALADREKAYLEADRLWREYFAEMVKSDKRAIKMSRKAQYWLDRWKAGAFELDAATMAMLAEQESMTGETEFGGSIHPTGRKY